MKIVFLYNIERLLRKKVKKFFKNKKLIKDLNKYKYFHIMNNGIHSIYVIHFFLDNFNSKEHCFIFPFMRDETKKQLLCYNNIYNTSLHNIPIENAKKIIFHGLFTRDLINFLYKNKKFLNKSFWFIWGGDLYKIIDDKKSIYVKKNFAGILTSFDYEIYKELYGKNKCYDLTYPSGMKLSDKRIKISSEETINILVNNSADETTIEMLNILYKFKNYNINIYTILSYISANQKDLRLIIMKTGYELFGQKFKPIIDFMPSDEYRRFLETIHIYISNQSRQQGNGNASYVCSIGGKVYMRNVSSIYKKYNSLGIKYFDTELIKIQNFNDFIYYDEITRNSTIALIRKRMSIKNKVSQWNAFFNDDI